MGQKANLHFIILLLKIEKKQGATNSRMLEDGEADLNTLTLLERLLVALAQEQVIKMRAFLGEYIIVTHKTVSFYDHRKICFYRTKIFWEISGNQDNFMSTLEKMELRA